MKINIPKTTLWLFLLCICQFFAVFQTGSFIYKADLINMTVIILSILVIMVCKLKPILKKNSENYIKVWIKIQLIFYIIECIYSTFLYSKYGQSFSGTIASSFGILSIISFFPLFFLQEKISDVDYLKKAIKKVGCIAAIFSIIQVFLYNYGIILLDITGTSIRYGTLRFGIAGYIVSIGLIIALFDYFYNNKRKDLFYIIIGVIYFLYASKTRTEMMYILGSVYVVVILFVKNKTVKTLMIFSAIVMVIVLLYSGFFSKYLFELSNDAGINMRFETIEYYINQFKEKPILGMGFIKINLNDTLDAIVYGNRGYYFRDDVGFIGLLNERGIIGGILYIALVVNLFKMVFFMYKKDKRKNVWMVAVCVYISFCSINIIYTNSLRIATVMLFASMIYHYYCHYKCNMGTLDTKNSLFIT